MSVLLVETTAIPTLPAQILKKATIAPAKEVMTINGQDLEGKVRRILLATGLFVIRTSVQISL
jgi:hypothetical protein